MNTKPTDPLDLIVWSYKMGWMTAGDAVRELLTVDPIRFQRQAHRAYAFLTNN